MLENAPGLPVDFKNSWDSASMEMRDNRKGLRGDPDCNGLKILLLGGLGVFEYIRELFDKKHGIYNQSITYLY